MALTFYFDSCATKFEFDDFCMHFVTHVMLEWMTRFHTKGEIALVGCSSEVGARAALWAGLAVLGAVAPFRLARAGRAKSAVLRFSY